MATFADFSLNNAPASGSYIVGYNATGTAEQRTTVADLLSTSLLYLPSTVTLPGLTLTTNVLSGNHSRTSFGGGSAIGTKSFAEGSSTTASGANSHAEGSTTTASGNNSHAEGTGTVASGNNSHAEGNSTLVSGVNSHAEGNSTLVSGVASHAEGEVTVASGDFSHAEGYSTATGRRNAFATYTAATRTFTFAPAISANFAFVVPGIILRGYDNDYSGDFFTITVASRNSTTGAISATVDAIGGNSSNGYLIDNSGVYSHAEGASTTASGVYSHAEGANTTASGVYSHAEGSSTTASGVYSHAEGISTTARGTTSHAAGSYAEAAHDRSWIWRGSTAINTISTTRTDQFMVSAAGGIYFPSNVGIGTDNNANALTVKGTISATSITAGSITYTSADFNNLPTYKTYQTNVAVKDANYSAVSAAQLAETDYFNSNATYAMPGGLVIKGHSPAYDTVVRNLPGFGVYGMRIQNVNSMDPGTTFVSDGRVAVTHAMSFRAGVDTFTAGADHNHVQWQGAPSNNTQAWQMTNGGSLNVYNYGANTYSQRFMVHTLPQYQISTAITAISGNFDTRNANLVTGTDRVSGVVILLDAYSAPVNYNLIAPGSVVGVTLNPGLVGLVAVIYNTQCTQVSANAAGLTAYQLDFFIGLGTNWVPASRGIQAVNLQSRTNGGNPGVNLITSQIGTNGNTQYVGITGSYRNMNKHALARFTTANILTGFKPGSPLTLWIPTAMPSSSPIGTGFITSDKIATFAQGTFPTGVRTGYFDAYVINVSGTDMEFSLCSLMDSYSFENRFWPCSAIGTAGWLLYGGTQDTVHRPTFGTTGFYFEREPWYFDGTNYLSGGMVKCVGLGTSEVYGDFSYGLGFRGVVLGKKSGTFAGDYNAVFGDNSVALGGSNLISISSNQVVMGTFNNPSTSALLVVGTGTNNANRANVLEVNSNSVTVAGNISASGIIYSNQINTLGTGTPTISSGSDIQLNAVTRVTVATTPLRLANLSSIQRDALTPLFGDLIYNTTTNKFQGYASTGWVDLS